MSTLKSASETDVPASVNVPVTFEVRPTPSVD